MERNSKPISPSPRTRTAEEKYDNDYETFEDDLVDHQRQVPSEQSNRRSVPRKPPRKVPSAYSPSDGAAIAASIALGLQKPRPPQQTTIRSTVFIPHKLSSPPPAPSTNRPSISKLSPAPLLPVPPSARSSTKNFPPLSVVPTVPPQIPPLSYHRAAPLVPRTASSQAPPPAPTTVSIRADPIVPRTASCTAPLPNRPSAPLRVHLQNHPTVISRPSIPPPPPPIVPNPSPPSVPPQPPSSLLSSPPPLVHTRFLPPTPSTASHPTQYSTLSAYSSIYSNISNSHSLSTTLSGRTMSNTYSLSNLQPFQSSHSLSSVHLPPLTASRSAPETGTHVVSDRSFPAQESQQLSASESAQRQQSRETPPAVREPSNPCHTFHYEAYSSSHGLTDGSYQIDLNKRSSINDIDNTDSNNSLLNNVGNSQKLKALLQSPDAPKGLNTSYLQPGVSFLLSSSSILTKSGGENRDGQCDLSCEATDMKGMLLKLVDRKWKSRYFVLRSKFWALEYYQTMADAQSTSEVVRGVYPLLGAETSGLVEVNKGFLFILTLRTSQMIQLKLPEKTAIERWRQSIQATAQHPLPNFIGEAKNGTAEVVQSRHSTTRNIRLNFLSRYLYFYKKNRQDMLTGLHLIDAHITMEKGSKKGFDITIKTPKEIQTVLRFPTLEEWVSWGTALESCAINK